MGPATKDKRVYLIWCMQHLLFPRREMYWLLDYLLNHPALLANIHFVEGADKTERGLIIHTKPTSAPIILTLAGQEFTDVDQIFHEIRLHWKQPLYLEIIFETSWKTPLYLGVLEDNPAQSWNTSIDEEVLENVDESLREFALEAKKVELRDLIDEALERGDEALFLKLSAELKLQEK